jgi:hypothetical protein
MMDKTQFDAMVKALDASGSRRRVLATLVGVTLTGSLGRTEGTAKGQRQPRKRQGAKAEDDTLKPNGKKCTKHGQCLSGNCSRAAGLKQGTCKTSCPALPPQTVTVTFSPYDNADLCVLDIHLRGLTSNTAHKVDVTVKFEDEPEVTVQENVTTDDCGSADFSPYVLPKGALVRAAVGTVSSGALVPIAC